MLRLGADRAALPPALVFQRLGDHLLPQSFYGEGACYLQISGPVRPVIVNGHRGRVAGVRTPACEAGRITG